jgi:hypothetical protein
MSRLEHFHDLGCFVAAMRSVSRSRMGFGICVWFQENEDLEMVLMGVHFNAV